MQSSAIRELLTLTERPDMISFAGGLPAPDVFPVAEFQEACQRVLADHGPQALQYSTTEGYRPLREMIARHRARYGIVIAPDNILLTSGSQQPRDLIGKIFINPGDRLLVEKPTYVGALQAWNAYQAECITIALDEVIRRLVQAKQGADLHTSTLIQVIAYEVARGGFLDRHVRVIRAVYRERRDATLAALGQYFPASVLWTKPQGGLFLWATLPEPIDAAEILHMAIAENVAFSRHPQRLSPHDSASSRRQSR
jgi:DNA-binding transcriptional MocR family regulator